MRGFVSLIILASALMVTTVYSQDSTQLRGPKGADYGAQSRSIGPIKPTDTLWRIAVKVRPDNSVSIYQVMQALYNKNPNSFLEQNLNHMQSGSYLKIPTLAEIRRVNPQLAKQRSEQDDELWEKKKNGTLTQAEINSAQTQVTQARKADVDEAKKELQQELKAIKTDQGNKLVELQQQFKSSVSNVEEILVENNNLKKQLTGISNELEKVRLQLSQDSEIQQQLKELIVKQNEIIAQQKLKDAEQENEFSFAALLSNPLVLILLMTIPALLIIFAVVMWLRKRGNNQEPESNNDEFISQAPAYTDPLDEMPEPTLDEAPAPDPLDDLSVQLDENMDDVLLDEVEFNDDLDDDSLLDQDELESLLNDDVVFEDENTESDELDVFMQQDFDSPDEDDTGDAINLDESDDILSADDLDSLLDEEDDDALPDEPKGESNDDMAALSEELAEEGEDFDIDDLLDENNEQATDTSADDDEFDIDDLLDAEQPANVESKDADIDSLVDEDDEFDIDDLLDVEQPANVESKGADIDSLVDEDGEFDIDDLLDAEQSATEAQTEEPNIDSLVDEDDEVDIDELLDAEQPTTEAQTEEPNIDSLVDEDDEVDIDELLDAEQPTTEAQTEEPDIDSLIDEDEVDIGDVLDTEQPESDVHDSEIDHALADSIEDLTDAQEELNSEDVESIASSFAEPEPEPEPETEAEQEIAAEPELDVESEDDFTDTSSNLLDLEDALDEYNDENLDSADELLSELEQTSDDYVEAPDWSVDGLDEQSESETEPELEAEPGLEAAPDVGSEDDLTDTSSTLLDPEDAPDEYDDENFKSVDDLLGELEVTGDEDEQVPDWSMDDLDGDLDEEEIDLGDDPLAGDIQSNDLSSEDDELYEPEIITPSEELGEYPELELDDELPLSDEEQQSLTPEELQGDNLDGDATGMSPSQAEQDLANALSAGNDLDSLEDEFDDELLLNNEFSELDIEQALGNDISESADLTEQAADEQVVSSNDDFDDDQFDALTESAEFTDQQTNADREADLTQASVPTESEMISDDELDDEFMADLTQTDFDSLLNELAEPDDVDLSDSSEFNVDFNSLLNEDLADDKAPSLQELIEQPEVTEPLDQDDFVDIDALLEQSDDADIDHEPYTDVDMDVGLGDYDSLLAGDNPMDVDTQSGGYSAKLDLAHAYIEIDDADSAVKILDEIINNGPDDVQEEAQNLKAKLKN